jgi:ubiquinone/menaquinone biosynthesis C-methylase UbiE
MRDSKRSAAAHPLRSSTASIQHLRDLRDNQLTAKGFTCATEPLCLKSLLYTIFRIFLTRLSGTSMSVFNSLYANEYDTLYLEKDYVGECALVESAIKQFGRPVRSILDVGCGTGSHAIEFARRGYQVTGVDLSQSMLDVAARKAADETLDHQPKWITGDARKFAADSHFDIATMLFAVVSYLTTNDDVLEGLSNIRRHLRPGSLFLCDFWYGPAVLSVRPNERVRVLETGGRRTIRAASTTVDSFSQTADVSFRLWSIEGDHYLGEAQETHRMRYFFPQEFKVLLNQAGFACKSLTAFPTLDQRLTDESWNAFCVAEAV